MCPIPCSYQKAGEEEQEEEQEQEEEEEEQAKISTRCIRRQATLRRTGSLCLCIIGLRQNIEWWQNASTVDQVINCQHCPPPSSHFNFLEIL